MSDRTVFGDLFIGGEWVKPHSAKVIESIDPSDETVWAVVPEGDETDIDRAVQAARIALDGPWKTKVTATQRGELLYKLAGLINRDAQKLARIESRDNGKPLRDTLGEMKRAADWLTFFAGAADKINGDQIPYRPDALAYTRREPVGVVAAILPWNSPILLACWKLGPALAAGNTVVIKPAEQTPASALELAKLVQEAGFPAGVVNVVTGLGRGAGAALAAHRGVNKISFTGSHATAIEIMKTGANTLKRCAFECGGKSPHIIFGDADIEKALVVAFHSAFRSTGQSCSLGSRLFVERSHYARVIDHLAAKASTVRIGPPLDEKTQIGPQNSAQQLEKTQSYIQLGKDAGARLVTGGGRPPGLPKGYYVEPTIFADVDNKSRLAQEEVFGPVLSIIPFDSEEEAICLANDVEYGLVAGLWTSDVTRAHRVSAALQAGTVSVNTFRPVHWMLPYGGYKMSGFGRENGLEAINDFTQTKTVVVDLSTGKPDDPFA